MTLHRAASGPGDLDLTVYGLRKFCRLPEKPDIDAVDRFVRSARA